MRAPCRRLVPVVVGGLLALPLAAPLAPPLAAQRGCNVRAEVCPDPGFPPLAPSTHDGSSLQVLAVNAAVGAVGTALFAHLTGRPVVRAAALGALGGAITYGGKRIAVQRFDGAGLLARQVGAVGASFTRDALEGVPPFRRVILPLGLARLHVDATAARPVRLRADLASLVATAVVLADGGRPDLAISLSNGTPTFRVDRLAPDWRGAHVAGVIWLREDPYVGTEAATLAHERVHVIQHDASFIGWTEPIERALLPDIPGMRWLHRWADVGLQVPLRASANAILSYESRPWEWEAGVLAGTIR